MDIHLKTRSLLVVVMQNLRRMFPFDIFLGGGRRELYNFWGGGRRQAEEEQLSGGISSVLYHCAFAVKFTMYWVCCLFPATAIASRAEVGGWTAGLTIGHLAYIEFKHIDKKTNHQVHE